MAYLEKQLFIDKSNIPGAGQGLFTKKNIEKGATIVRYKGKKTTWKEAKKNNGENMYLMYVTSKNVIDASNHTKTFARYANDAKGLTKVKGLKNNSQYVHDKKGRVYLEAKRDIEAGEEILVGYGAEYWDTVRENLKLEKAS